MRLNWRRTVMYAAIAVVEISVLQTLLELIDKPLTGGQINLYLFPLTYAVSFVLNRFMLWRRWPAWLSFAVNILLWTAATAVLVKAQLLPALALTDGEWLLAVPRAIANLVNVFEPALLVLLGGTLAWWLGCRLARTRIGFALALGEFQFGLAAILLMFFSAEALEVRMGNPVVLALVFFAAGLVAASLAHAEEGAGRTGGALHANWSWLLTGTIVIVLVVGFVISWIVSPGLLNAIIIAAGWVLEQVWNVIVWLVSLLPEPSLPDNVTAGNMTGLDMEERAITFGLPEVWLSGLRLAWNVLFIGLILFALWRVSTQIFSWMRRRMGGSEGEVESMPGAFRADFFGFLKRLFQRLLGLRPKLRVVRREPKEIANVRQLYRQVLGWAAQAGWRRADFQTPYEYLPSLEKMLPSCAAEFRLITEHYINARYGGAPPTPEEMRRLKESWRQINHFRPPPAETD